MCFMTDRGLKSGDCAFTMVFLKQSTTHATLLNKLHWNNVWYSQQILPGNFMKKRFINKNINLTQHYAEYSIEDLEWNET
jgi:hypothetical protein